MADLGCHAEDQLLQRQQEPPPMRRIPPTVLTFAKLPSSRLESPVTKLHSVKCRMVPASWPESPRFVRKAARLHAAAPDIADIVERLLDELLAEVT